MAYFTDPTPVLDEFVTTLHGLGIEAAVDTDKVHAPGVWVRWVGPDLSLLDGTEYQRVELCLVVGAMPLSEAYRQLVALAEEVVEAFGHPDGPIRQQATTFGGDPVALPSLVLSYLGTVTA